MLKGLKELEARKRDLVAASELQRMDLTLQMGSLDQRTRWIQYTYEAVVTYGPKLSFLFPVAGALVARRIPVLKEGNWIGAAGVAWRLFKQGKALMEGVKAARASLPGSR